MRKGKYKCSKHERTELCILCNAIKRKKKVLHASLETNRLMINLANYHKRCPLISAHLDESKSSRVIFCAMQISINYNLLRIFTNNQHATLTKKCT